MQKHDTVECEQKAKVVQKLEERAGDNPDISRIINFIHNEMLADGKPRIAFESAKVPQPYMYTDHKSKQTIIGFDGDDKYAVMKAAKKTAESITTYFLEAEELPAQKPQDVAFKEGMKDYRKKRPRIATESKSKTIIFAG